MSEQRQPRSPYRVFETERDYREHIARVVGWRIGREQGRTRQAERRAEAAERERNELEREVEELAARLGALKRDEHGAAS